MKNKLAPICLFVYNRPETTKQTIEALQANFLAKDSNLFIFSDGPKDEKSKTKVKTIRNYLKTISGFNKITINESLENKGLANSIISGVTKIINDYGKIIVLEDDLITTPNFLNFMNQALVYYTNSTRIFSVSGYTMNLSVLKKINKDYYFGCRASSWGWATWKENWNTVDWDVKHYNDFIKDKKAKKRFNRGGSDMSRMLKAQMNGKIDSWAILFCFQQFLDNKACVFPQLSKVQSIGFSKDATHTQGAIKFITQLDNSNKQKFYFENFINYDKDILNQFKNKFSIKQRILDNLIKK